MCHWWFGRKLGVRTWLFSIINIYQVNRESIQEKTGYKDDRLIVKRSLYCLMMLQRERKTLICFFQIIYSCIILLKVFDLKQQNRNQIMIQLHVLAPSYSIPMFTWKLTANLLSRAVYDPGAARGVNFLLHGYP